MLATQILELCAQGLGLARDTFTKPFDGTAGDCISRINYYPPCPLSSLTLGLGAHTDPNLLTILSQCKVGGLQVCKNGTWISVKPKPDTLILNIGDTFEVCNQLTATLFKVLSTVCLQLDFDNCE
jgi:isopenicillin N synthase-like dioxygenase